MLKARIGNTIILGLDKENIKRLQNGAPILVKKENILTESRA